MMMRQAAIWYARFGWPVFPCHTPRFNGDNLLGCSCGVRDCKSVGKHPRVRNGVKEASADVAQVNRWWLQWPNANIGLRTGTEGCGAVVLDVDPRHGGEASLASLGELPRGPEVFTGSGGAHLFFQAFPISLRAGFLPGLDVRGDNGYVIAAPSLHASGKRYSWQANAWPHRVPLPEAPPWLRSMMQKPERPAAPAPRRASTPVAPGSPLERAIRYARQIEPAIEGSGGDHWTFTVVARLVRGFDLDDASALVALREWNDRCQPPWKERDLLEKVRNARRYGGEAIGGRLRRAG
jgi:hypothetical protein